MGTPTRRRASFRNGRLEPQRLQKTCVNRSASGTLKETNSSSPRVKEKASCGKKRLEAKAAPVDARHREQWQLCDQTGLSVSSYRTAPHKHPPENLLLISPPNGPGAQLRAACVPRGYSGGRPPLLPPN